MPELEEMQDYQNCRLCPRDCQVNRLQGKKGICGETAQLRVASIEAHFGEEPPISGVNGSGTVFFSGCSLRCVFCQNYQISCFHLGQYTTSAEVAERLHQLYRKQAIHNVNFVTPDHFLPHTMEIVTLLRQQNVTIPILYNTSGYSSIETVKRLSEYADIYMPDFKYADEEVAFELSRCRDYPVVALNALVEMVKQKGFLDAVVNEREVAHRGVLVRHLVLPGQVQNSLDALSMLFAELGAELPLSLMSQYRPVRMVKNAEMNRPLAGEEFYRVYEHALSLGFRNLFVQPLMRSWEDDDEFLPDFSQDRPFRGNVRR